MESSRQCDSSQGIYAWGPLKLKNSGSGWVHTAHCTVHFIVYILCGRIFKELLRNWLSLTRDKVLSMVPIVQILNRWV
jgi:hypothetical protein